MTKQNLKVIGAFAGVVLLAFIAWNVRHLSSPITSLLGANECASGQTCLPSMEFTGAGGGVTNTLQIDAGILNNAGTLTQSGASTFTGTFKLGSTGTTQNQQNTGLCYLYPYAATVPASGSAYVECQATSNASGAGGGGALAVLSGITANSFVSVALSTTTAMNLGTTSVISSGSPLILAGASASTTAGYITLRVYNSSTSPYVWPTAVAVSNASGTATYFVAK